MQLRQDTGSLETAQLEPRAAVEIKDEEAAKSGLAKPGNSKVGKSDVWNPDKTHKWLNTTTRDQLGTFPAWRTSGEDAPVDGVQNMSSAEVAAGADQPSAPAEVAAGAASVEVAAGADQESASAEVAADAKPAENQDPEAEAEGAQPTDPEAPPKWLNTTTRDPPRRVISQIPCQSDATT